MDLGTLPVIGEYSIMGFLLTIIIWFIYAILTGRLVPRRTLEDEKETTNTFKAAWETEREVTEGLSDLVKDLTVVGENMEKVLNALPSHDGGDES